MPDVHHGGISAGGNVSIGGDVDMSVTASGDQPAAEVRPVTDDLRQGVGELLAALDAAGLTRRPPFAEAAIELRSEVDGPTAHPARIEQIVAAIERNAIQITAVAVAVTAIREALSR